MDEKMLVQRLYVHYTFFNTSGLIIFRTVMPALTRKGVIKALRNHQTSILSPQNNVWLNNATSIHEMAKLPDPKFQTGRPFRESIMLVCDNCWRKLEMISITKRECLWVKTIFRLLADQEN